jgi:SAM-dependent methyltransferase
MKTQCRICQSEDTLVIKQIQSPHFNKTFDLYNCRQCTSRFFIEKDKKILSELYEKLAVNTAYINLEFKLNPYWSHQKEIITKLYRGRIKSVLDVGCRTGDFLMHFDTNTIREGVELSKQQAEVTNKRGVKVYQDFLENIEFSRTYDVVSAYAILEHLVDPEAFLKKLNSLVEKKGLLVILIPTFQCFKEKILNILNVQWHMYSPPEHLNFYSKKFLDDYLTKNGFVLVKRYYSSGGIFNPFKKFPLLGKVFGKIMFYYDQTPANKVPIFDHLYCYYKKL